MVNAQFCNWEDSHNYFLARQGMLRCRRIPLALHTDHRPVFKHRSEYQPAGTPIRFRKAMGELGQSNVRPISPG